MTTPAPASPTPRQAVTDPAVRRSPRWLGRRLPRLPAAAFAAASLLATSTATAGTWPPPGPRTFQFVTAGPNTGNIHVKGDPNANGGYPAQVYNIDGTTFTYSTADGRGVWTFDGDLEFAAGDVIEVIGNTPVSLRAVADGSETGDITIPSGATVDLSGARRFRTSDPDDKPFSANGGGGLGGVGGTNGSPGSPGDPGVAATGAVAISGGAGGAGGQGDQSSNSGAAGGSGGHGGGTLELIAAGTLTVPGTLTTAGSDGSDYDGSAGSGTDTGDAGGGGGGGGGDLHLGATTLVLTGSADATGGRGGTGEPAPSAPGPDGTAGAGGRLIFTVLGTETDGSTVASVQTAGAVVKRGAGDLRVTGANGVTVGGSGGPASLSVAAGTFEIDRHLTVDAGGAATVDGTGSALAAGTGLSVGQSGAGTLAVTGGGKASSTHDTTLGSSSGSSGTVTVDGADSSLSAGTYLNVGYSGAGTLEVTGGGKASSTDSTVIGLFAGSSGTATVSGADAQGTGSRLEVGGDLLVGGHYYGHVGPPVAGGAASLSVADGGEVDVKGATTVWKQVTVGADGLFGTDELTLLSGGTFTVDAAGLGANAGALTVDTGTTLGDGTYAGGTLTVNGAAALGTTGIDNGGSLIVGDGAAVTAGGVTMGATNGGGTLDLTGATAGNAATLTAAGLTVNGGTLLTDGRSVLNLGALGYAGAAASLLGDVNVGGTATFDGPNAVTLGDGSGGTFDAAVLDLTGTGSVALAGGAAATVAGASTVGADAGLTVHAGTTLLDTPTGTTAGSLFGQSLIVNGTASLGLTDVRTGGTLTVAGTADTKDQNGAGSLRALTVTGGSVGVTGTGVLNGTTLALTAGGDATGAGDVNLSGAATVDGAGSTLAVDGGTFDAASLALTDGGVLQAGGGAVTLAGDATVTGGNAAGGTDRAAAEVTSDGADHGSLTVGGDLVVDGDAGEAEVHVLDDATLAVTGAATVTGDDGEILVGSDGDGSAGAVGFRAGTLAVEDGGSVEVGNAGLGIVGSAVIAGAATVEGGTLTVAGGGTLDAADAGVADGGELIAAGRVTVADHLAVDGSGAEATVGATGTLEAGTLAVGTGGLSGADGEVTVEDGGTLTVAGESAVVDLGAGPQTVHTGTTLLGGDLTVEGGTADLAATGIGENGLLSVEGGAVSTRDGGAVLRDLTVAADAVLAGVEISGGTFTTGDAALAGSGARLAVGAGAAGAEGFLANALSLDGGGTLTIGDAADSADVVTGAAKIFGDVTLDGAATTASIDAGSALGVLADLDLKGGSTLTLAGAATVAGETAVDGAGSLLTVTADGALDTDTLDLTGGGGLLSLGELNVTGAATVDGAGSGLAVNAGTFDAASLELTGQGSAAIAGVATLIGAASADGDDALLIVHSAGTLHGVDLDLTGGGDAATAGDVNLSGAASVAGTGSALNVTAGTFDAVSLDVTGGGVAVTEGAVTLTGAASVDGTDSVLNVKAGTFDADSLALTGGGGARVAAAATLAGAASAAGADSLLEVTADGSMTADALDLTGGADLLSAGDVTLAGAATADGAGSVLNVNGGTFDAASLAVTDGGDAGLTGAVTLAGAATVDGADSVLGVGGGSFRAASLAVTNDADAFTAVDATLSGAATVGGAGSRLRVTGGTLTADRLSVTGGALTTVAAGATLATANGAGVGAGSTLAVTGTATDRGTFDLDGTATVLGGGLLDLLDLDQTGGGVLDVRRGGTLRVNGAWLTDSFILAEGATLTGATTIAAANGFTLAGTLAPGNSPGRTTVNGDLNAGPTAVFDIEVNPVAAGVTPVPGVDFDQIVVTGAAVIDGGTVRASQFAPGELTVGTRYDFLTASRLTVVTPLTLQTAGDLRLVSAFGPTSYSLIVGRDGGNAALGRTFNQRAVGGALDAAPAGGLRDAIETLPTDAAAAAALGDLSGEIYGTHLTALNRSGVRFLDALAARGAAFPPGCGACGAGGLSGWADVSGAGGKVDGNGNARRADLGTVGTAVGLSRVFGEENLCVSVGGFYGYESLTTRVNAARSSVTDDLHRVGATVRASAGGAFVRAAGFGGYADGAARRAVRIDNPNLPLTDRTTADLDGFLAAGDAEAGFLFGLPAAFVAPVVGVRYAHVNRDGFAETGGPTALIVEDAALHELRARLGARAGLRTAAIPALPVAGTLEAFYSRDVSAGSVGDSTAAFAAAPGTAFTARGTDFGRDRVVFGPGLTLGGGPVTFATHYRAGLSREAVLHGGDVRLEICF